jgi:hypothetical protein
MKAGSLLIATTLLVACASQGEKAKHSTQDQAQAVRDFIAVRQLEELDSLSSGSNDRWTSIDDDFLIYKGRRGDYLVEFNRRCYELSDNTRIIADERWGLNAIHARSDTIRGCRIAKIYALTEAEVAELENIGDAVGSRN